MTHFLRDILRQPLELQRTLDHLSGPGRSALSYAAQAIRNSNHVYLTGIGSSWHAALTAAPMFSTGGRPVYLQDASEILHSAKLPPGSVLIVISRSGRSVEIVHLLEKAREAGAFVIGITNSPDGTLAQQAQVPLVIAIALDHAISVNTYTTLAATLGLLASLVVDSCNDALVASLSRSIAAVDPLISTWQAQIANSRWLSPGRTHYFLARGSSLGSCNETRLLWEEGVKAPATAMATASFRHGPQEMIAEGMRFGIWLDGQHMRVEDLALARDMNVLGASVMLIGQDVPGNPAELSFQLPEILPDWQFLLDIIPAQLTAERMAALAGVDCDSFRLCDFIVEDEGGLLSEKSRSAQNDGRKL